MDFRSVMKIPPSPVKITYNDPVMFIGSCFATSIGSKFEAGRMKVMINPSGTVYNPVSVANTIETIFLGKDCTISDLYNYNGLWLSFNHYTDFSSENPEEVLSRINSKAAEAAGFLSASKFLFVTFGTARVYIRKQTGMVVSNCHKIPAKEFDRKLLSVNEIGNMWNLLLDRIKDSYPGLQVVFTVSPVRHLKDGAHGNQVSKSVLFLAVEELLRHRSQPLYFPAYEIMMDDLRDYRFYDDDLVHPSSAATEYIWEIFRECWFDPEASELWKEVNGILKAVSHRIKSGRESDIRAFCGKMISEITRLESLHPGLNLEKEKKYFSDLQHAGRTI